jgi:hypothetical protein
MLVLTLEPGEESLKIGDITLHFSSGLKSGFILRKIRIAVDAPKEFRVERIKKIKEVK